MLTVAVTGGTGFIGKMVIKYLLQEGFNVISLQRSESNNENITVRKFDLRNKKTINSDLLKGVDIIIHTAAVVHNSKANSKDYFQQNYEASKKLYELSKEMNLKKFIFLSTVGVYGLRSNPLPLNIFSKVNPITDYAKSKLSSENFFFSKINKQTKLTVLRVPLVYGQGAPGSYGLLEKISRKKIPLPFSSINNKRSIISVEKLAKVLVNSCKNLNLYEGLHLIAEKKTVSTKELVVQLRSFYKISPMLFPIPKKLMQIILFFLGKRKIYEQLYEDMVFQSTIDL